MRSAAVRVEHQRHQIVDVERLVRHAIGATRKGIRAPSVQFAAVPQRLSRLAEQRGHGHRATAKGATPPDARSRTDPHRDTGPHASLSGPLHHCRHRLNSRSRGQRRGRRLHVNLAPLDKRRDRREPHPGGTFRRPPHRARRVLVESRGKQTKGTDSSAGRTRMLISVTNRDPMSLQQASTRPRSCRCI